MTFLEKALEINKTEGGKQTESEIIRRSCPYDFGLDDRYVCNRVGEEKCFDCWNREMPNTEAKTKSQIALEKIEDLLVHGVDRKELFEHISAYGDAIADTHYNKGLNDGRNEVWELLDKLSHAIIKSVLVEVFGYSYVEDIIDHFTPQEALAKLKAYEETHSKIEVGDVVEITHCDEKFKGLVLDILDEISFVLLTENGMVESYVDERVKKTGKHIDISSILEQIGE